jgi:hypothetical protein
VFNVADSLLCVGVFFMIVYSLFFAPRDPEATQSRENAGTDQRVTSDQPPARV